MNDQLVDQSLRMFTKAPRVGYRTAHLVLNCICLAIAAHEYYFFYDAENRKSMTLEYYKDAMNPGKSSRIAYFVIVTGLTMASAVLHGIGNASRPNKLHAIKPVSEGIYYLFSGGLLIILSIVLLVRFCGEMESNPHQNPFMLTVIVLSFTDAMVYLAAAVDAWITRSEN